MRRRGGVSHNYGNSFESRRHASSLTALAQLLTFSRKCGALPQKSWIHQMCQIDLVSSKIGHDSCKTQVSKSVCAQSVDVSISGCLLFLCAHPKHSRLISFCCCVSEMGTNIISHQAASDFYWSQSFAKA